jgi:hypothetical protein
VTEPKAAGNRGKGRKPGIPNRVTRQAKEAIALAAEELGGVERLVAWARSDEKNEAVFWSSIYPRLIPVAVEGNVNAEHHHTHDPAGLSDAIAWLAAARGEAPATTH